MTVTGRILLANVGIIVVVIMIVGTSKQQTTNLLGVVRSYLAITLAGQAIIEKDCGNFCLARSKKLHVEQLVGGER